MLVSGCRKSSCALVSYDPRRHHRRSIRLKGYDYSQPGAYYVTICVREGECLLGGVTDGAMVLSEAGQIVQRTWDGLPSRFPTVELDTFVIMPNHVHGIVVIVDEPGGGAVTGQGAAREGAASGAPTRTRGKRPTLGQIVRAFKSISAIQVNRCLGRSGSRLWQRNYYERIIRDENELHRARKYILGNPAKWETGDPENPLRHMKS